MAAGDSQTALRPVVELFEKDVPAVVEVRHGFFNHLNGVFFLDALGFADGLFAFKFTIVFGLIEHVAIDPFFACIPVVLGGVLVVGEISHEDGAECLVELVDGAVSPTSGPEVNHLNAKVGNDKIFIVGVHVVDEIVGLLAVSVIIEHLSENGFPTILVEEGFVVQRVMKHHHVVHLGEKVFFHNGFTQPHKLLVGHYLVGQVGQILDGFGVVMAKLCFVVQVPFAVMVWTRDVKWAGEHLLQVAQRNE